MIRHIEIETAETYELQIFNLIEEIQDTIESTENNSELDTAGKQIPQPNWH